MKLFFIWLLSILANNVYGAPIEPIRKVAVISMLDPFIVQTENKNRIIYNDVTRMPCHFVYYKELNEFIEDTIQDSLRGKFEFIDVSISDQSAGWKSYEKVDEFFKTHKQTLSSMARDYQIDAFLIVYPYPKVCEEKVSPLGGVLDRQLSKEITKAMGNTYMSGIELTNDSSFIEFDSQIELFDVREWKYSNKSSKPKAISGHKLDLLVEFDTSLICHNVPLTDIEQQWVYHYLKQNLPARIEKVLSYMKTLHKEADKNK